MEILNSLQEVSNKLNDKYSKITDFNTQVIDDVVKGGFYKMTYADRLANNGIVSYYFHETFGRLYPQEPYNVVTYNDLFNYLDNTIQKQLRWQKSQDEKYSEEFGKKLVYKYDYSLIDA